MKNTFDNVYKNGKMVIDGALATQLEAMGCDLNDELWSAKILFENPELIKKVHINYFKAGADCGISASYQATVEGYMKRGFSEKEAEMLIRRSVDTLIDARKQWWQDEGKDSGRVYPLVAASVGPYGAYLADGSEYRGGYSITDAELKEFHKKRMEILWDEGAEILAVETIPSLREALACAQICEEIGAECWISFSCKNSTEICEGTKIAECAKALETFDCVKAVGLNCTAPHFVEGLIIEIKGVSKKPVIVYPNSGEEYNPVTKTWHGGKGGMTYGMWAEKWYKAGATLIGGCCRTTPENIREVYDVINSKK
ncbi:MAG: homocysteine S-methyltransferase [Clostridia bacterium]|jgi:homocysteine S-methyltransferase|nr:homocysteine S-methyltransferase [Clostridia bacterium]MCI1999156.1 homocysteine S-methyltransferase [Clostridia bacterium]MCI2014891.1 homocysteine S-methyltransferase [Clostridia bacterium]